MNRWKVADEFLTSKNILKYSNLPKGYDLINFFSEIKLATIVLDETFNADYENNNHFSIRWKKFPHRHDWKNFFSIPCGSFFASYAKNYTMGFKYENCGDIKYYFSTFKLTLHCLKYVANIKFSFELIH